MIFHPQQLIDDLVRIHTAKLGVHPRYLVLGNETHKKLVEQTSRDMDLTGRQKHPSYGDHFYDGMSIIVVYNNPWYMEVV